MIGSGYKKFAQENGLKVAQGVAYGSLRGYNVVLDEGSGWKRIQINTKITDPASVGVLVNCLHDKNAMKEYRLRDTSCSENGVTIMFIDSIGTLKRIRAFVDWFFPMLDSSGASRSNCCDECGLELGGRGTWKLVGTTAFHLHESCAARIENEVRAMEQERLNNDDGSYMTGITGALLGALLGAAVWAVIYSLGFMTALVGLLIGFLAVKGYDLFHGKQGKLKVVIVLASIVLAVVVGNVAVYWWQLFQMVQSGELPIEVSEIFPALSLMLETNDELRSAVTKDMLLGIFFGLLGGISIVLNAAKGIGKTKITTLE